MDNIKGLYTLSWLPNNYKENILLFLKYCSTYKKLFNKYLKFKILDYACTPLYDENTQILYDDVKPLTNHYDSFDEILNGDKMETVIIPFSGDNDITHKQTINMLSNDYTKEKYDESFKRHGYGYTNFKIINGINHITYIELICGGSRINWDHPCATKNEYPFNIIKKCVLPMAQWHEYKIEIYCNGPCTISYDIVKIKNPQNEYRINGKYEFHKQMATNSNKTQIELNYYCIVDKIKLVTSANIKNVVLSIEYSNKTFKIPFDKKQNKWTLRCINYYIALYRRGDEKYNAKLMYDTDTSTKQVYDINLSLSGFQPITIMHGMICGMLSLNFGLDLP